MSLETLTQEYLKARKAFDNIAVASSAWSGDPKLGFLRNKIAHAGPCVTNPCAIGRIQASFLGQTKCCFSIGGVIYALDGTLDLTVTLPQTGPNTWELSDPTAFTTTQKYVTNPGACPDASQGDLQQAHGGSLILTLSGTTWIFISTTDMFGTPYLDFNGSSTSLVIPNGIVGCGGFTSAFGGTITLVLP